MPIPLPKPYTVDRSPALMDSLLFRHVEIHSTIEEGALRPRLTFTTVAFSSETGEVDEKSEKIHREIDVAALMQTHPTVATAFEAMLAALNEINSIL